MELSILTITKLASLTFSIYLLYVCEAIVDSKVKQIVLFDWYVLTFRAAATMHMDARVR